MRYRTLLFTTPGLAMIFSLAACGDEQSTSHFADGPSGPATVQPSGPPADALTIQVKASAQAPAKTWTLNCAPTGGDHPKAADACAALAKTKEPFKPVPKDQICTEIYGGPEIATVKGTWEGKRIDTRFTRQNGCQLHRWSAVGALFGDVPKVR
ncbi:SSI family serine proteinase inhibitor [Actinomadura roseirufa]|uniref:SSI family serine proteinase inhibitor n=1 Tax=Actinomadura roseirufa TaxID=2094049 RepID=UPI001040FED2|nr:SSI family serine proteinase inhibitor [Actinomadura roseirufa]